MRGKFVNCLHELKPREARILLPEETGRGGEEIGAPGEGGGLEGEGGGEGGKRGDLERTVLEEPKRKTLDEDGGERLGIL